MWWFRDTFKRRYKRCTQTSLSNKWQICYWKSIEELVNYGFNNLLLTIGYKSNIFVEFINRLKEKYKTNIDVFIENKPLGECGALWLIKDKLSQQFVFINGDLIFSMDFWKLISFHQRLSSNLTLVTHTSDHPNDSDLVSAPNGTLIEDIFIKGLKKRNEGSAYLGNSGIFVLNKSILDNIKPPDENESNIIAEKWKPFRGSAALLLWHYYSKKND